MTTSAKGHAVPDQTGKAETHVDALIARYAPGHSVREIERKNNFPQGSLASHLKPAKRGRFPRLDVQQRFANALGAPLQEVSAAFAADSQVSILQTEPLPLDAQQVLDDYQALNPQNRALAAEIISTIRRRQETSTPDT